jgi:Caspase domain
VFFYAGHGLQVGGQNYLVPVDAKAETADALDFEMVRLDLVQRTMERAVPTNILFLDACRNNPLARNLARAMGTRSAEIGRGLAPVESGVGTLISFSTQPGNVALDGTGRNSPFAGALVRHLATSDSLSDLLIAVRNDVRKETENKQVPWEHSALTGRFYFNQASQPVPSEQPAPTLAFRLSEAAEAWAAAKDTRSIAVLEDFIARYKDTFYAGLARARIEELKKAATAATNPGGATKEAAPMQRNLREAARDSLYQAIMQILSQRRSPRDREQSVSENYREAPNPKALAVCLDWSMAVPNRLDPGAIGGTYTDRGTTGCRGLSSEQCSRYTVSRCHERGLCRSKGQECVLLDVNGRNALKLNEAWARRFGQ